MNEEKTVKIKEIELGEFNTERFEYIKSHLEACTGKRYTNEEVARLLIGIGIINYRFS